MSAPTFSMSLRVWHPKRSADEILRVVRLPIRFHHTVGDPRKTPKGTPLEGIYKETYCCFELEKKTREYPERRITHWCQVIEAHSEFLADLVQTGGKAEFYVSVFLDGDRGFELDNELLTRMCAFRLGIAVEMYRLGDSEVVVNGP
jgi:hypothetical protein